MWELACQRWHLCGLAERPRCSGSRASSLLQGVVVAGGNLVGAGLPAMASLLSGGTTGGLEDREQARSYRGLWWLADLVGAGLPAMASLLSGGTTGVPADREQARSYRGLWWLADLVGAGLPAMASLRSGGTTGVPEDREQARSYRGLWWLAVILWELACQRWHHCGLAERPGCQRIASKLAPTGVCGGWRILWELACQRWHLCDRATSVKP